MKKGWENMTPKPLPFKYFYQGKHLRSSYHEYTHAVLTGADELIACRNGKENAEKAKQAEKLTYKRDLAYYEAMLKALRAGRSCFECKIGRMKNWITIRPGTTEASILEKIKMDEAAIDFIEKTYKVVPLVKM